MINSGQVPEDLQQLYEEGSKNSPPPRLFKSQFINKVFQQNSEIRTNKSQVTRLPHSIMFWKNIHGNQQALSDAQDEVMSIRKMVTIMSGQ